MNIFYLDEDVQKCAEMHVDKHVVKMILEYAQLLSTAHRVLDGEPMIGRTKTGRRQQQYKLDNDGDERLMYKATHMNHPSAIWCRENTENYQWLADLLVALCKEYTYRYSKKHAVERSGLMTKLVNKMPRNIRPGTWTEPTPAMPDEYKVDGDHLESYHNYYRGDKPRMFSWKKREVPVWINTYDRTPKNKPSDRQSIIMENLNANL
jgi:hypothetical protein